jgi:uncharacterized membrane-anchored protein
MSKVVLLIEAFADSLVAALLTYYTIMLAYYDHRNDTRWTIYIKRIAYIMCWFAVTSVLTFIIRNVIPQLRDQ